MIKGQRIDTVLNETHYLQNSIHYSIDSTGEIEHGLSKQLIIPLPINMNFHSMIFHGMIF